MRQLRNVVERLLIFGGSGEEGAICAEDLPGEIVVLAPAALVGVGGESLVALPLC